MRYICFITLLFFGLSCFSQDVKHANCYGEKRMFKEFFKKEVVYPDCALKSNIQGTVVLSFIVDEKGLIQKLKVVKSVSGEIDQEAIRVFNKLLWNPAIYRGAPIGEQLTLSLKFNIKKYKRWCNERGYTELKYSYHPIDSSNRIYNYRDLNTVPQAIFKGEKVSLKKYIADNIRYPDDAYKNNITGTVTIEFIIEINGVISNVRTKNSIGAGCSGEAIRLIKQLDWLPGIKDNKAVRTRIFLDVTFGLHNLSGYIYVPNNQNAVTL